VIDRQDVDRPSLRIDLEAELLAHRREERRAVGVDRRQPDRGRLSIEPLRNLVGRPAQREHHPLGWTQAPEDWESLQSQRCRWRRGLLQVLWRQLGVIANPRYGVIGLGVLPYIAVFEGLGPLLEITGYVVTVAAAAAGLLNWQYARVLILVSVLFGTAVTMVAVLLSDVGTRRYMGGRDLGLLVAVVLLENCGYLNAWWGFVGTIQALTGKRGWGVMKRRAFEDENVASKVQGTTARS
jgi:cellulose synthase/poly-beta-1,6-N-acetylglucosamine synthase-like glycosyltransferase